MANISPKCHVSDPQFLTVNWNIWNINWNIYFRSPLQEHKTFCLETFRPQPVIGSFFLLMFTEHEQIAAISTFMQPPWLCSRLWKNCGAKMDVVKSKFALFDWNVQECWLLSAPGHAPRTKQLQAAQNKLCSLVYICLNTFSKRPCEVFFFVLFCFNCSTEGAVVRKRVSRTIRMATVLMVTPAEATWEDQSEGL